MPYIEDCERFQGRFNTPGKLNYKIHEIIEFYLEKEESYTKYNEVIGVLECVKLELYRRAVSAYEQQKMKENGDISFYYNREYVNE